MLLQVAIAKVEDLQERYSELLLLSNNKAEPVTDPLSFTFSNTQTETMLDFGAVLKASQVVSRELELEKLLENLMKIIIENAGARWGYLMLPSQEETPVTIDSLRIEAAGDAENNNIVVLQSLSLENRLPQSVIDRVIRTKKAVVCNDARRELVNKSDRYLQQQDRKSVV